jgi:hypothetical protein
VPWCFLWAINRGAAVAPVIAGFLASAPVLLFFSFLALLFGTI